MTDESLPEESDLEIYEVESPRELNIHADKNYYNSNEILSRLDGIEQSLEALKTGVNTIGEMMNGVAGAFEQIVAEVQKGGMAGLLGSLMGGKKNG
jgi:hypothetical protein